MEPHSRNQKKKADHVHVHVNAHVNVYVNVHVDVYVDVGVDMNVIGLCNAQILAVLERILG